MKITKNESPSPQTEPVAGSFYSLAQLLQGFAERHNLGQLLDEMTPDEAVDHILKKRKEKSM